MHWLTSCKVPPHIGSFGRGARTLFRRTLCDVNKVLVSARSRCSHPQIPIPVAVGSMPWFNVTLSCVVMLILPMTLAAHKLRQASSVRSMTNRFEGIWDHLWLIHLWCRETVDFFSQRFTVPYGFVVSNEPIWCLLLPANIARYGQKLRLIIATLSVSLHRSKVFCSYPFLSCTSLVFCNHLHFLQPQSTVTTVHMIPHQYFQLFFVYCICVLNVLASVYPKFHRLSSQSNRSPHPPSFCMYTECNLLLHQSLNCCMVWFRSAWLSWSFHLKFVVLKFEP